jgi:hypothetical protein
VRSATNQLNLDRGLGLSSFPELHTPLDRPLSTALGNLSAGSSLNVLSDNARGAVLMPYPNFLSRISTSPCTPVGPATSSLLTSMDSCTAAFRTVGMLLRADFGLVGTGVRLAD